MSQDCRVFISREVQCLGGLIFKKFPGTHRSDRRGRRQSLYDTWERKDHRRSLFPVEGPRFLCFCDNTSSGPRLRRVPRLRNDSIVSTVPKNVVVQRKGVSRVTDDRTRRRGSLRVETSVYLLTPQPFQRVP